MHRFLPALLMLLGLLLCGATAATAQPRQWFPPGGAVSIAVDLAGRVVSEVPLAQGVPDPWNGARWAGCGGTNIDLFGDRYFGGNRVPGSNPQGFANELMHLNALAVIKAVTGSVEGNYLPLCIEVWDWAFTHPKSCIAYGLTVADGCGSIGGNPGRIPESVIAYCETWPDACFPFPGCPCAVCWNDIRVNGFGGLVIRYDATRTECRPDRLVIKPACENDPDECDEAKERLRSSVEDTLRVLRGGS